jgi:quercetin dioxygenase-like cupin family protein
MATKVKSKTATGRKSKEHEVPLARATRRHQTCGQQDAVAIHPLAHHPAGRTEPALQRQFVVGQEIMLARVLLKKGCIVPEHSHHNEQLTYILDGALKFWIDGKEIVVHAGEVLCIPANMPHKAEALEDTVDLDVFTPPRADWINKSDQYLRGAK